jgi:sugar phosphate isomerase/epimerase
LTVRIGGADGINVLAAARAPGQTRTAMIRLGTVAAIGFDDFPPGEWLACFRELGCQVVQAYRNHAKGVSIAQMREALAAGGMPCDSLHGVFGEEFDPSCPDDGARAFAVQTYKHEADVCQALGGGVVVVHCSTIRRDGVSDQERWLRVQQLKRSIEELGRFGEGRGVRYAFENLPAYHVVGSDVGELARILDEVGAPNTGMCFDSGHANMVGDAAQAVADAAGKIIYIHVSDNSRTADEHEMITRGTIDADALARAIHRSGYDGTLMLEVFYKVDRLRELIAEGLAERLARIVRIANGQE